MNYHKMLQMVMKNDCHRILLKMLVQTNGARIGLVHITPLGQPT